MLKKYIVKVFIAIDIVFSAWNCIDMFGRMMRFKGLKSARKSETI